MQITVQMPLVRVCEMPLHTTESGGLEIDSVNPGVASQRPLDMESRQDTVTPSSFVGSDAQVRLCRYSTSITMQPCQITGCSSPVREVKRFVSIGEVAQLPQLEVRMPIIND